MLWCQVHAVAVLTQASGQNHTQPGDTLLDAIESALAFSLLFRESKLKLLKLRMHYE